MSKITIKEVRPAADDSHPTIIIDDTGAQMSGFDTKLKDLHPGDSIDIELKPKGKYLNIVKFTVLEKAAEVGARRAVPLQDSNPTADYTRRIELDIDARYRTVSLECAVSLAAAGKLTSLNDVTLHADQYYCWLTGRPQPKVSASGPTPAVVKGEPVRPVDPPAKPWDDKRGLQDDKRGTHDDKRGLHDDKSGRQDDKRGTHDDKSGRQDNKTQADTDFAKLGRQPEDQGDRGDKLEFTNAGEFYAACVKEKGYNKSEVDKELKARFNLAHPVQRAEAWAFILGLPAKKKEG